MVLFKNLSPKNILPAGSISVRLDIRGMMATVGSVLGSDARKGLARRIRAHKVMNELDQLDDHMLADIGLVREDLHWAMRQSQQLDPVQALRERRRESLHEEHLAVVRAYRRAARQ